MTDDGRASSAETADGSPLPSISGPTLDRLFTLTLLGFVGLLLVLTPQYDADSRVFPLVIGVPTLIGLAVLFVLQSTDRFDSLTGRFDDVLGAREGVFRAEAGVRDERDDLRTGRIRVVRIVGWAFLLFALVSLFGFYAGIVAFLPPFFRYQAEQSVLRSLLYAAATAAFVVLVFGVVLNTPFYGGLLLS